MRSWIHTTDNISRAIAWFGGGLMLLSAIMISVDVIVRNLFKTPLVWSFEFASYAFAIAVSSGMAYALLSRAHIRIEVVYNLFPPKVRAVLDVISILSMTVTVGVLCYWVGAMVLENFESGARSNTSLGIKMWIPQGIWLLGFFWLLAVAALLTVIGIYHLLRNRPEEVARAIGIGTLQDEIDASVELAPQTSRGG